MSRIRSTSPNSTTIRNTSELAPTVSAEQFAEAIGAERVVQRMARASPPSLLGLRQELHRRLQSTGGRPGLDDVTRRQKIPLSDEDWQRLAALADAASTDEIKPTPSQIASVLIRQALEALDALEAQGPEVHGT